jgi:hypothetical protein
MTNTISEIYITCPHCDTNILIMFNEINCAIFRHGTIRETFTQINPHETKEICDKLFHENKIYGCGKPFRLVNTSNQYVAEICEYI